MKVDLNGKTALITGAGGAIGAMTAKIFAQNGAAVAVCDIRLDTARQTAEEIIAAGGCAEAFEADVTDLAGCRATAAAVCERFGKIDILVNNAGVNVSSKDRLPIHEFSEEKWSWIIGVDLDGVYKCSRAVIPHMLPGGGCVINISSIVGLVPLRNQCAFTAAKAGVVNLSKAMAIELAEKDIRVNAICPGSILMEGTRELFYADRERTEAILSHIPQHKPGKPEDIAYTALFLASSEASYITGSVITVDGGWTCGFARDF